MSFTKDAIIIIYEIIDVNIIITGQIITFFAYLLIIFGLCRIGFIINSGILNSAITGAYGSNSLPVSDIIKIPNSTVFLIEIELFIFSIFLYILL